MTLLEWVRTSCGDRRLPAGLCQVYIKDLHLVFTKSDHKVAGGG